MWVGDVLVGVCGWGVCGWCIDDGYGKTDSTRYEGVCIRGVGVCLCLRCRGGWVYG